jgi:hypothetical protein
MVEKPVLYQIASASSAGAFCPSAQPHMREPRVLGVVRTVTPLISQNMFRSLMTW